MPARTTVLELTLLVVVAALLPVAARAQPALAAGASTTPARALNADPGDDLRLAFFHCPSDPGQRSQYQTYTVPSDTHSVYVEAVGGQGMTPDRNQTGWGGLGAEVTGTINADPGDVLSVGVGCHGTSEGGASPYGPGGAKGEGRSFADAFVSGFGIDGGGGGGASAVLLNGRPLAVAGGGGGASGGATDCYGINDSVPPGAGAQSGLGDGIVYYACFPPVWTPGADGGAGGLPAGNGGVGPTNPNPATPGGGACVAGQPTAGQRGQDFDHASAGGAGGGGGGGYAGGCGGKAGPMSPGYPWGGAVVTGIPGNAGGGGSSYADPSVSNAAFSTADNSGDGYVLFLSGAENTRTTHFAYTGSVDTSTCTPAHTDRIFVDALGGTGAGLPAFPNTGLGGGGGRVQAVVPVQEGTRLGVTVGQGGTSGHAFGGGQGGNRGTAASDAAFSGAGGGGSSTVQASTTPCDGAAPPGATFTDLVVAGGGGGGGGDGYQNDGGDGGHGGNPAASGGGGDGVIHGDGGCGGCNASIAGGDGTPSTTGGGGGGGGGGYRGGGLGHGAPDGSTGGGGGGGGGLSFAAQPDPTQVAYTVGGDSQQGGGNGSVTLIVPFPSKWSEVDILGGDKQSAYPGQALAEPLRVQALDSLGFPIRNAPITFSAPAGHANLNGAGAMYSTTTDSSGNASVSVTAPTPGRTPGAYSVTAEVTGTQNTYVQAARFSLFNNLLPTAVTMASSTQGNPSNPDQPVQFTASVMTAPPDPYHPGSTQPSSYGIPTGSVQFSDTFNGVTTPLGGPVTLDASGTAKSAMLSGLTKGTHQVTAAYLGDSGHQVFDQSDASLAQAVDMSLVTATLSPSATHVPAGTPVNLTLQVSPPAQVQASPTGTVQFVVDGVDAGAPVALGSTGAAVSPPVPDLGVGLHVAAALYSGDAGFVSAVRTTTLYVQAPTTVALVKNSDGSVTATVRPATAGVTDLPQGLVTFSNTADNQGGLAQIPLNAAGSATLPATVKLCCFINTIVAAYGGEDRFQPSQAQVTVYDLGSTGPPGTPPPSPPPPHRPPALHWPPPLLPIVARVLAILVHLLRDLFGFLR